MAQRPDANVASLEEHTMRVKREYEKHLAKHDPASPEAAHWTGKEKTWLRFEVLSGIGDLNGKRVLDFGSGNGLLLDFLKERGISCRYQGWDISQKMVEAAEAGHPEAEFRVCDILHDELSAYRDYFDYVLVSGVFYIKADARRDVHEAWTREILLALWPLCRRGLGANFLTKHVDWEDDTLYYCSVADITSLCASNLSRRFVIRHDYPLYEFTVYAYKNSR